MANVSLWGTDYTNVPALDVPQTGGGEVRFYEVGGSQTITQNNTYDVTSLAQVVVNVSGGAPVIESLSVTPTTSQQTFDSSSVDGYKPVVVAAMSSGTAGTPTATKGTVSNHSVSVTPSVTNSTGYITGGTKTGTAVTVSASELVSGTYSVTSSGTKDVTNYASASVPAGSATAPSSISGTSASVSTGTNTITLSKTVSVTPSVSAGYVSSGTAGNSSVSLSASVTTKGATSYYATTSDQTIASGTYLTGTQTIKALSQTNLSAENIKSGTTITINNGNANVWSVLGTYTGGGGGTDRLVLLQTTSLGALSTSSTSAASTNKTVTLASSTNWDDYDLLIVDISVDSITNNRHTSSVSFVINTGTSSVSTKNTYTVGSNVWNSRLSSSGTASSRQSTSKYGIYVNSASVSSSTLSLPIYYRYNSNNTGTINGNYTARVYGINLIDLIGG